MKVTYNAKTKVFNLIYLDPLKVYKGVKHPYTRKQKTWKSPFPPKKEQQERIKHEMMQLAFAEIEKAEKEIARLADIEEVKKQIEKADYGDEMLPMAAFRPLVKKAIINAFESVNWERFINWNELYHEIEKFIKERHDIQNDPDFDPDDREI